jgi:D-3-phosphoglycerate dehydrogenase
VRTEAPTPSLGGVDVLVTTSGVRVTEDVLSQLSGKLVLTTTSGHDHIDGVAAARHGVTVARCPLARRDAVVAWSLAEGIAGMRRLGALHQAAADGRWARADLPALAPIGLADARVAVIGMGVIGQRMATVLATLGAEVLPVDPRPIPGWRCVDLETALEVADWVTLHCALSPTSRGLIGARQLARLRPTAVVVNAARGDVLDLDAAVDAVRHGRLRALAVDVFPVEPWTSLRDAALPGVSFAPHAAGYTRDLGARVAAEVVDTLAAWASGAPLPHRVSPP